MKTNHTTKAFLAGAAMAGLMSGSTVRLQAAQAGTVPGIFQAGTLTGSVVLDKHSCAGKNACKGQGGCKSGDHGCKGKNSCKGKGGCATDGSLL